MSFTESCPGRDCYEYIRDRFLKDFATLTTQESKYHKRFDVVIDKLSDITEILQELILYSAPTGPLLELQSDLYAMVADHYAVALSNVDDEVDDVEWSSRLELLTQIVGDYHKQLTALQRELRGKVTYTARDPATIKELLNGFQKAVRVGVSVVMDERKKFMVNFVLSTYTSILDERQLQMIQKSCAMDVFDKMRPPVEFLASLALLTFITAQLPKDAALRIVVSEILGQVDKWGDLWGSPSPFISKILENLGPYLLPYWKEFSSPEMLEKILRFFLEPLIALDNTKSPAQDVDANVCYLIGEVKSNFAEHGVEITQHLSNACSPKVLSDFKKSLVDIADFKELYKTKDKGYLWNSDVAVTKDDFVLAAQRLSVSAQEFPFLLRLFMRMTANAVMCSNVRKRASTWQIIARILSRIDIPKEDRQGWARTTEIPLDVDRSRFRKKLSSGASHT